MVVIEHLFPVGRDVDGLEILPEKIGTVEIVAVVHEDQILRVEAVNKISAPEIRGENGFVYLALRNHIHCFDGKTRGVKVRVHDWARAEITTVCRCPEADDD